MTDKVTIFKNSGELLAKVTREGRRVNFHRNEVELLDAFFNFCISAHSIRDWCIKELKLNEDEKNQFHESCNKHKYLEYVRDIANGSKHFGLDKNKKSTVESVAACEASFTYMNITENILGKSENETTVKLLLPNGEDVFVFVFLNQVVRSLRSIMDNYGLPYDKYKCNPINMSKVSSSQ